MSTIPDHADNSAQHWRGLSNQLTPDQVHYLENWEAEPGFPGQPDSALLRAAREFAAHNAAAIAYADITPPPDAVLIDEWTASEANHLDMRFFAGSRRVVESINIDIYGWQYSDGHIERTVRVESPQPGNDGDMPAALAFQVAAALVEAAREIEGLQ